MILMLNCSYKVKSSNTEFFFSLLKDEIEHMSDRECEMVSIRDVVKSDDTMEVFVSDLKKAKALVIGAPLYVDGLPAQAVKLMEILLEKYKGEIPKLPVYVVSNLGFYEAGQIKHLLAIVENWCKRIGFAYGGTAITNSLIIRKFYGNKYYAENFGVLNFSGALSAFIGPSVVGLIQVSTGTYATVMMYFIAIAAISFVIQHFIKKA